ncbi:MAG TPA: hypothetical protein VFE62_27715 [Gemmataceae bacterium]|nr:hypothetical protein [Gemmataceae bacterium]
MSNKTPNTSLQSTKQMLDELDALMEKMLTLPVNELDEAAPPPAMPSVPEPRLSATVTLLEPPPQPEARPASRPAAPPPSYQAPELEPAAPLPLNPPHFELPPIHDLNAPANWPTESVPAPPAPTYETPAPLTNDVTPPSVLPKLEPMLEEPAAAAATLDTQALIAPLLWVNQGFERTTLMFGGAGRLARSEAGRMMLGLSGFVLMAAGVVWFLKDWLGWNW